MNEHQEFIESRAQQIRRAVWIAREQGLTDSQILIVLVDSDQERDTWPAGPPSGVQPLAEYSQVACTAMGISAAKTLLDSLCRVLEVPTLPGSVRVLAITAGTGFFTHVVVEDPC